MTEQAPKTIKLFLLDGSPTGVKKIQLSNWSGLGYIIPRNRLDVLKESGREQDFKKQCLYFLASNNSIDPEIYIGEAENFTNRINDDDHRRREFWNLCIAFFSKDENLSKAHIRFLEAEFISDTKKANRAKLHNMTEPDGPKLAEEDRHEMFEFKMSVKIILSALGFTFHENITEQKDRLTNLFSIKTKGIKATGIFSSEGMTLLAGSQIVKNEVRSIPPSIQTLRADKIQKQFVEDEGNCFKVLRNITFDSPSGAAGFVMARSANGWNEWKNDKGRTLDQVERKKTS